MSSNRSSAACISVPRRSIFSRSGSVFSSSAAIRFGGRFQTRLNQSTKIRASARRVERIERRFRKAALEVLEDNGRVEEDRPSVVEHRHQGLTADTLDLAAVG